MEKNKIRTLENSCWRIIATSGAVLDMKDTGVHYELSSGLHTRIFYQFNPAYAQAGHRRRMSRLLACRIKRAGINPRRITILLGPAIGALPLIYGLQMLEEFSNTKAMFAERAGGNGRYVLGSGFKIKPSDQVLVIDDVGTTFRTIRNTIEAAHEACRPYGWEAFIVGFAVFMERIPEGNTPPNVFAPALKYAYGLKSPSRVAAYPVSRCPDCPHTPLIRHKSKDTDNLELPF